MGAGVESMMSRRILLRQGAGPETFHGNAPVFAACPRHAVESQEDLAFNQSPLFSILMGKRNYNARPGECRLQHFGWQKPCYPLQDGTPIPFKELMETTEWANYGRVGQSAMRQLHGALRLRTTSWTICSGPLRGFADAVKVTFSLYPTRSARRSRSERCARCTPITRGSD